MVPWHFLALLSVADGHSSYKSYIPNGNKVQRNGVYALESGHKQGSYALNAFGASFQSNGYAWTRLLCQEDSDGDGQSNGFELGDPDCVWTRGGTPARTTDISHPGFADSTTSAAGGSGGVGATTTASSAASGEGGLSGAAPTAPATTATPPIAAAPSACQASSFKFNGKAYSCMIKFDYLDEAALHWSVQEGSSGVVDVALVAPGVGAGGWLSLAFPSETGRMVGGHAVAATASGVRIVDMPSYSGPYPTLAQSALRVPIQGATSGIQDGQLVLAISGASMVLTKADFIFGLADGCPWPCEHTRRGGSVLNLLTGTADAPPDTVPRDALFVYSVVGLLLMALAGPLVSGTALRKPSNPFFSKQLRIGTTPFGVAVFSWVVLCLTLASIAPLLSRADADGVMRGAGLGAGLAATLPLLFVTRLGVHTAFAVSREVAFHVHAFVGVLLLLFGTAHGIAATAVQGADVVWGKGSLAIGGVGLLLMWAGVLPAAAHNLKPRAFRYDMFKVVHMASGLGYFFSFLHIFLLVTERFDLPRVVLLALNVLVLFWFTSQRMQMLLTTRRALVHSAQPLVDNNGMRHLALELKVKGFSYEAGQWARLHIPSIGLVGHPFTIVPGDVDGRPGERIRFFVKADGRFTSRMADSGLRDKTVRVEGPYGNPALREASKWGSAVALVVGGVGVTPALSFAPIASSTGSPAFLYWSLRSDRLFRACAPLLKPHIDSGLSYCQVTREDGGVGASPETEDGPIEIPLAAARKDVVGWLGNVAAEAKRRADAQQQAPRLFVFLCGPPGMVAAARQAVTKLSEDMPDMEFQLHEETFRFLQSFR